MLWFYDPWIADSYSVGDNGLCFGFMTHGLQILIQLGTLVVLWFYESWIADSNSVGDNGLCFGFMIHGLQIQIQLVTLLSALVL